MNTHIRFPAPLIIFCILFVLLAPDAVKGQYVRRGEYATEHDRRMQYALDDWISYLKSRSFTSMTVGTNYIYIGTRDGGILRYHLYDNYWDYPFTTSNGLPDNFIHQVLYDQDTAYLWAVTPNDLAIFNPASEEWIRKSENPNWVYEFPDTTEPNDPNAPEKERFFGREALLQLPTYFANGEYSILNDWFLLDEHFQEFEFVGYLRDRYDRIWFLVDGFGIGQGDTYSQRADFYGLGLPDISPRVIRYQKDDLWIGGIGKDRPGRPGVVRWPYEGPGWDYFQARWISRLPSDDVNDILVDGDSAWFATEYGVTVYDTGNDRWRNYNLGDGLISNEVDDLAKLGNNIYAATDQGISRINILTSTVEKIKDTRFINLPVHQLAVQKDTLWAATFRGIFRYPASVKKWEFVPSKAAIQDLEITAVNSFKNEVWFASSGSIMFLDLRTETWQSFPQIAFEIGGPFTDIQVNGAAVWVATPNGLLKYDKERRYWRLFTTRDGLLNNNCHRLMLDGDFIWIATDEGVTQFYWNNPDRID